MYDRFRWTNVSARRNSVTMEYEPLQPFFLMALAEESGCGTLVDVGANVGAYSLFGTLVPTVERVVAFEANPDTAEELRFNIALNGLELKVEVREKAVSSAPGKLSLGVVSKYSGANSVVQTSIHDRSTFYKEITVDAVVLDQEFPQPSSKPLAIKIDVEGHESEVIDGGRHLLQANQAIVQLEFYERSHASSRQKLEELGYFRLTAIGPDNYFSNIERFRDPTTVVEAYEEAVRRSIAFNHRNKSVIIKRGDFALQLTGKTADVARSMAKRLIGKRL
jgi:FkbM family methyltransferase